VKIRAEGALLISLSPGGEGRGEGRSVVRQYLSFIFRGWRIAMCVS
jgi:hypothetical protein